MPLGEARAFRLGVCHIAGKQVLLTEVLTQKACRWAAEQTMLRWHLSHKLAVVEQMLCTSDNCMLGTTVIPHVLQPDCAEHTTLVIKE